MVGVNIGSNAKIIVVAKPKSKRQKPEIKNKMYILMLMLAISDSVKCEISAIPSQFEQNNNVNYVVNPDQSFASEDKRTLYPPYGFYGTPVNHFSDNYEPLQPAKVKKDVNGASLGNSIALDDIRNDLLNIKENVASLKLYQKNFDNNVNQKLATINVRPFPKLLTRLNHYSNRLPAMDNNEDEDFEPEIVSLPRHEINYANGLEYTAPPLPDQPYGQNHYVYSYINNKKHKDMQKKNVGKGLQLSSKRKLRDEAARRAAVRRANALQRHAQRTLAFIRNGIVNALWTALVVASVKLLPLLLFGAKLLFQSVIPLAGMAVLEKRRGLFANEVAENNEEDDDLEENDSVSNKEY